MSDFLIYKEGREVIALEKNTGKKGIAKCHPNSKFDIEIGAALAFKRLMKTIKEWEEPYNGYVFVAKNEQVEGFTQGKIYQVVDGYIIDDDGFKRPDTSIGGSRTLERLKWFYNNGRHHMEFYEVKNKDVIQKTAEKKEAENTNMALILSNHVCSNCNSRIYRPMDKRDVQYCSHCGAKFVEEEE